jgi:putative endonuclease
MGGRHKAGHDRGFVVGVEGGNVEGGLGAKAHLPCLSWPALCRPPIVQHSPLPMGSKPVQRTHDYFVYMLASKPYGTLYIGVTNDLLRRLEEHRNGTGGVFTRRYHVHRLVWFEHWRDVEGAIQRETSLKRWRRDWKINLLERDNPHWVDLFPSLTGGV